MKLKIFSLAAALLFVASVSQAQQSNLREKLEVKPRFGASFLYTEQGLGVSGSYYKPVFKNTDLFINISITGIADSKEFEQFDERGESYIRDKENRLIRIPVSIGLEKRIFSDILDGGIAPTISAGVAPTLVLSSPYDKGFVEQFSYFTAAFAIGGYVGAGLELTKPGSSGVSFSAKYYYLPVLGEEIKSVKNQPIKNVGGLQIGFGYKF